MADGIRITPQLNVLNDNFRFDIIAETITVTQNEIGGGVPGFVIATPTESTVDLSALTAPGYCYAKNLDDDYYADFGPDATGIQPFIRLKPGEIAIFRVTPTATFKIQSEAGSSGITPSVKIQLFIFED